MQSSSYYRVAIDRNLLLILLGVIVFLFLANALLIPFASELKSIKSPLRYVIRQIDLNLEGNFATWFSSMLLLLNSLSAYMLSRARWSTKRRVALTTAIMAAGLLLLSVDEFIGIHEFLERVMVYEFSNNHSMDSSTVKMIGPLFSISLTIILVVLVAGPYLHAVQRKNILFLIASIACVFTLGLAEFVYRLSGCTEPWCFRIEVLFDEVGELAALLLFLTFQSRELAGLDDQAADHVFDRSLVRKLSKTLFAKTRQSNTK